MNLTGRLSVVRVQLDLLAATRLDEPLSAELERTYGALCDREE